MAPLPENNTGTLFVDYEGPFGKRSFQMRGAASATPADVVAVATSFINQLKTLTAPSTIWTGARWRAKGSNFSLPVPFTAIPGTGPTAPSPPDYPRFVDFVGRTDGGRRVRLAVYGLFVAVSDDYRITGTEQATINAARAILQTNSAILVGIDGAPITWKNYANAGYNAYFQRKRRIAG